ncbi:hypothetical protein SNEBB_011431 [Seison nebaliae]|nr:hypothetical protein SNEBB_011431 [Seison nebaliae]
MDNDNFGKVYLNGFFNGYKSDSHMVLFPTYHQFVIENVTKIYEKFHFSNVTHYSIYENDEVRIEQIDYVHRFYIQTFITQLRFFKKTGNNVTINIDDRYNASEDLITKAEVYKYGNHLYSFMSRVSEWPNVVKQRAFMVANSLPTQIQLRTDKKQYDLFSTIGYVKNKAIREFDEVSTLLKDESLHDYVLSNHVERWSNEYDDKSISMKYSHSLPDERLEKLDRIEQAIESSKYYILSSFIPDIIFDNTVKVNYGIYFLSANPSLQMKHHRTWDTEMWIFPYVNLINDQYARQIIDYRLETGWSNVESITGTTTQTTYLAHESTMSGHDVSDNRISNPQLFLYTNAAFTSAVRNYLSAIPTEECLRTNCRKIVSILKLICQYQWNLTQFSDHFYNVNNVHNWNSTGDLVDNDAFINFAFIMAINTYNWLTCEMNMKSDNFIAQKWLNKVNYEKLPYDYRFKIFHPQDPSIFTQLFKFSGGSMYSYPMNMENVERLQDARDVSYTYFCTSSQAQPNVFSMLLINELRIRPITNVSYDDIMMVSMKGFLASNPYRLWTYSLDNGTTVTNNVGAMASFLQIFYAGFGGIKLNSTALNINTYRQPYFNTTELKLNGIQYNGIIFNLNITKNQTNFYVKDIKSNSITEIYVNDVFLKEVEEKDNLFFSNKEKISLKKTQNACAPPRDKYSLISGTTIIRMRFYQFIMMVFLPLIFFEF